MNKESDEPDNESHNLELDTNKNKKSPYQEDLVKKYDSKIKLLMTEGCPI